MNGDSFRGFPPDMLDFYAGLAEHNSSAWFRAHRGIYESSVLEPARRFVEDMGARLASLDPGIVADPRIDKSIYRINRDIRFSPDKSPYKTHLGIWLWNNAAPRSESCGFYFQIETHRLLIGAGAYYFTREQLERYRRAVADGRRGAVLEEAIRRVTGAGYGVAGEHYKRAPRGYDPNHLRAALLRHNTLYAYEETPPPEALHSASFTDYCFDRCRDMLPIHRWLLDIISRGDGYEK